MFNIPYKLYNYDGTEVEVGEDPNENRVQWRVVAYDKVGNNITSSIGT
jgi:hypothetical protein